MPDSQTQAMVCGYFVDVAQHCLYVHRNFHVAFAITSAFSSVPIFRLKGLKINMSPGHLEKMKQLISFMSLSNNYGIYRSLIERTYLERSPAIPYFAVIGRDVQHMIEGFMNDLRLNQVNLFRIHAMFSEISRVMSFREYPFKVVPLSHTVKLNAAFQIGSGIAMSLSNSLLRKGIDGEDEANLQKDSSQSQLKFQNVQSQPQNNSQGGKIFTFRQKFKTPKSLEGCSPPELEQVFVQNARRLIQAENALNQSALQVQEDGSEDIVEEEQDDIFVDSTYSLNSASDTTSLHSPQKPSSKNTKNMKKGTNSSKLSGSSTENPSQSVADENSPAETTSNLSTQDKNSPAPKSPEGKKTSWFFHRRQKQVLEETQVIRHPSRETLKEVELVAVPEIQLEICFHMLHAIPKYDSSALLAKSLSVEPNMTNKEFGTHMGILKLYRQGLLKN